MFDGITIVVSAFLAGVVIIVCLVLFNSVDDGLTASGSLIPSQATTMMDTANSQAAWMGDFLLLMLFLGMPIASMLLAFLNDIHPLFFWASLGICLLLVILGGVFADSWLSIGSDTNLSPQVARLPMSSWVFSNYAIYALFAFAIIGGGVFVKSRNAVGY